MNIIDQLYRKSVSGESGDYSTQQITLGVVLDTNDPQQLGRVRAACPALQDNTDPLSREVTKIPWAYYCSPFGGVVREGFRGPNNDQTQGPVAYGMWAPPKVGSTVLVLCLDGDPQYRVYFGCLFGPQLTNTLPNGRFSANIPDEDQGEIYGPFSADETRIEPSFTNASTAFQDQNNPEWRTRGADYAATANDEQVVIKSAGFKKDDKDVEVPSTTGPLNHRQGYALNRKRLRDRSELTERIYDNYVYSITSPGFHSISMDDRIENGRMRFKTTTGHQIILDDTNERIYISTAEGENWLEMDQRGNVDLYSSRRISIHGDSDINIVAGDPEKGKKGDVRIQADNFHVTTREEVRVTAEGDMNFRTNGNYKSFVNGELKLESNGNIHYSTTGDMFTSAGGTLNQSSDVMIVESSGTMDLKAGGAMVQQGNNWSANGGGQVLITGGAVHLNGPTAPGASSATAATTADEIRANLPSRTPTHEPFPRTLNDIATDVTSTDQVPELKPELPADHADVNKKERGEKIPRNSYWRR